MMTTTTKRTYKSTESKYKGGADEMYVTYDVMQETRSGKAVSYPKVKRVYIAGKVKDWKVGRFEKRTGKRVRGVKISYEQSRAGYERKPYAAARGATQYKVSPAKVARGQASFSKVVEVPEAAKNVHFSKGKLTKKYKDALQAVR